MYKSKLNPDQRLIMKISDLPNLDRKSYIARLSEQAVSNIIQHLLNSDKWIYIHDGDTDRFTNSYLKATVAYDHTTESLSFHKEIG
jgi:hypothetical protein